MAERIADSHAHAGFELDNEVAGSLEDFGVSSQCADRFLLSYGDVTTRERDNVARSYALRYAELRTVNMKTIHTVCRAWTVLFARTRTTRNLGTPRSSVT